MNQENSQNLGQSNPEQKTPQLLTREDLKKLFHCSLRHVDNLRTHQGLPWVQVGRKVFFLLEDVQEWISRNRKAEKVPNFVEISVRGDCPQE